MLTQIHIQNFKSFGERTSIVLRPINLLYGRNSSGKSSILQAIRYLQQIFKERDADPSSIGIGDFNSVVHGQQTGDASIDFQIDGFWNALAIYPGGVRNEEGRNTRENCQPIDPMFEPKHGSPVIYSEVLWNRRDGLELGDSSVNDIAYSVKLSIRLNGVSDKPEITRYELILASEHFMSVWPLDDEGDHLDFDLRNLSHPIFNCDDLTTEKPVFGGSNTSGCANLFRTWLHSVPLNRTLLRGSCLPSCRNPYEFGRAFVGIDTPMEINPQYTESLEKAAFWVNYLMYGSFVQVQRDLDQVDHIGPLRRIPTRNNLRIANPPGQWHDSSKAWDSLEEMSDDSFQQAAGWLSEPTKLNLDYRLHREVLELRPKAIPVNNTTGVPRSSRIGEALTDIWLSSDVASRLEPTQVGVGVSQVVPIVAAVFDEIDWNNVVEGQCRLLMIEQPELHLHPEAQAALGDLFIEATRDNGRILLIETHSEPLLLRLLRRIKETATDEGNCQYPLKMSSISIQHFSMLDGQSKIKRIAVADDGSLADDWPDDLLSLSFNEVFGR